MSDNVSGTGQVDLLEGAFDMGRSVAAGVAAISLAVTATLGASPASAQDDWQVPSFEGMTLAEAEASWSSITGGAGELGTRIMNTTVHTPMNPATWQVCGQKPRPGTNVSSSASVAVAVAPPNACSG